MLCQELQSEFCYLAMFRRRVDFRGAGAAGNWNKNYCSGHLKGHHCRLPKSPLQKHAEKNGGRNWSPGTTHEILMHLYHSNESFFINKWTYANIATNLNSKIVTQRPDASMSRLRHLFSQAYHFFSSGWVCLCKCLFSASNVLNMC